MFLKNFFLQNSANSLDQYSYNICLLEEHLIIEWLNQWCYQSMICHTLQFKLYQFFFCKKKLFFYEHFASLTSQIDKCLDTYEVKW